MDKLLGGPTWYFLSFFLYKVICHFLFHPLKLLRWKMLPSIFVLLSMCKMLPFICLWQLEGGPVWAFSLYVAYHIYHGRNHILWLWEKYLWGRGDIGATILKSSEVIASHTLKQYGPTTSHTSQEQGLMEAHEDVQIIKNKQLESVMPL